MRGRVGTLDRILAAGVCAGVATYLTVTHALGDREKFRANRPRANRCCHRGPSARARPGPVAASASRPLQRLLEDGRNPSSTRSCRGSRAPLFDFASSVRRRLKCSHRRISRRSVSLSLLVSQRVADGVLQTPRERRTRAHVSLFEDLMRREAERLEHHCKGDQFHRAGTAINPVAETGEVYARAHPRHCAKRWDRFADSRRRSTAWSWTINAAEWALSRFRRGRKSAPSAAIIGALHPPAGRPIATASSTTSIRKIGLPTVCVLSGWAVRLATCDARGAFLVLCRSSMAVRKLATLAWPMNRACALLR